MRFDRTPKVEGLRWTSRMQALHLSRQDRARQKIERAYPLFSDQIETPQALSVDEERQRRERLLYQSEHRMRDLYAQQWRRLRREYFACTPDMHARIMEAWKAWRGPARPVCFAYVIEQHNGVGEEKSWRYREQEAAMVARIDAARAAQTALL
ncbi:hypothetical protein BTH42_34140 [Burkholderia sp. SRS-W-2-2016]|uniref:hypothetical protein n=1 Tax=Burkholderia sp. SRS-W-2-2016 TaxID=1926878 RepID=UPI00094B5970|nr:hypothetical protein [Burkholderia sp. SRS-W-2-2016]OLL27205.1 hypothetical protein BTH42_34140 [Burkholderia sp. SRS-W-2-2016]